MKRSIARKWAAALDSGEYKQITGKLRSGGGFCCLGVLCNLHAQDHPEIASTKLCKGNYLGEETELPTEVIDYAGMDNKEGYFKNSLQYELKGYRARSLVELNDECKLTFPEIAKIIRKHWKEL